MASLLDAGYTLRYLDFDANPQSLLAFSSSAGRARLQIVECRDAAAIAPNGAISTGTNEAVPTALKALNKWPLDESKAADWGEKDILVVDSGSVMAESALRRSLALNGRAGKRPQFGDFTNAHDSISNFLLFSKSALKCHFIMLTHLFLMGPNLGAEDIENDSLRERVIEKKLEGSDNVPWKLAPKTVGRALHDMAKHFSGVVYVTTRGPVRKLVLRPTDGVDAGVPVAGLPPDLPLETGMAKIFEASK